VTDRPQIMFNGPVGQALEIRLLEGMIPVMSAHMSGDRFAAFRHVSYARFFLARFLGAFATQIVSVSVGWQMYDETRSTFYLGLIGLFQFLPSLLLILVTGSVADRYNRRAIVAICMVVSALCGGSFLVLTATDAFSPILVFGILIVFGIERAFNAPAVQSLAPNLVPEADLSNAVAWNSTSWQMASIVGPVAGGLLYGLSPILSYAVAFVFFVAAAILVFMVERPTQKRSSKAVTWGTILAGFRFIWSEKVVLGAISLDLFAVLLGGAVALMPVFARDVLVLVRGGSGCFGRLQELALSSSRSFWRAFRSATMPVSSCLRALRSSVSGRCSSGSPKPRGFPSPH